MRWLLPRREPEGLRELIDSTLSLSNLVYNLIEPKKTESERTTFRLTLSLTLWIGKVKGLQAGRDLDWKPATVATIIIAVKIMQ